MPELAEVEYFRKQWDCGLNQKILAVHASGKRVFRGLDLARFQTALHGAKLLESHAHGKQMLFRLTRGVWLGVHLGMTGELLNEKNAFVPGRHDHLVLHQRGQSLVFRDSRQFGRILFDLGSQPPAWWRRLPPQILSPNFNLTRLRAFLARRARSPIKAVLLMQQGFPGIGNWMADEVLWQARLDPRRPAGSLNKTEIRRLLLCLKTVSRLAMKTIAVNWADPPRGWLLHYRWRDGGSCPRDNAPLRRSTIGGRTTCWCPKCQQ